jgi:hypothetical protein
MYTETFLQKLQEMSERQAVMKGDLGDMVLVEKTISCITVLFFCIYGIYIGYTFIYIVSFFTRNEQFIFKNMNKRPFNIEITVGKGSSVFDKFERASGSAVEIYFYGHRVTSGRSVVLIDK